MDITSFIVGLRADALLIGDYNQYRALLTRRLLTLGKRLKRTTPKGKKYSKKPAITAEDIGIDTGYAYILLLGAERAWAMAMHMRTVHAADTSRKGIIGSARRHIISRLNKATVHATQLVELLQEPASNTSNVNLLEARAYLASLSAAFSMEKHRWEQCLQQSSLARIIYTSLEKKLSQEPIRDFLSGTIDPSIRYASHQLKLPRSISLDTIAKQRFPNDPKVRAEVEAINPDCFSAEEAVDTAGVDGAPQAAPQTISWRSKTVKIEDAAISQALAAANVAETQLSSWISGAEGQSASWKEQAANYDNVIIASQDAVDATKAAIDDLSSEGVDQGDSRLQSLQVTKTAVNYILVGWRAGRNRVLCGEGDGLGSDPGSSKRSKKTKAKANPQEESIGRRIGGLRERLVLYNGILQSLDSVKELPGVAGDRGFMEGLEARRHYFQSLRCLAVGRSHALRSNPKNALALFSRALQLAPKSPPADSSESTSAPRLDISQSQIEALQAELQHLVWQYRGIVEIEKLVSEANQSERTTSTSTPMVDRLDEYPLEGVDLSNLVTYPPKMEPIPVKPLFLDVAWNYIDYPREGKRAIPSASAPATEAKEAKRGWFGFGR